MTDYDIEDATESVDVAAVHAGVYAADPADVPGRDYAAVSLVLRGPADAVVGGLLGATMWGWLTVDALWVAPEARGVGAGGRLLAAAEAVAVARGCAGARLDTFDFQARAFYERRGYFVYGQLDGFPVGHVQYHLRKTLPGHGAPVA